MTLDGHQVSDLFSKGQYATVARAGASEAWQTYAAMGLLGRVSEALEGLDRFPIEDARFYSAVAYWIAGDEESACKLLTRLQGKHAKNLLRLISQPQIRILAHAETGGSYDLIATSKSQNRFDVQRVGFGKTDRPDAPYKSVHELYDRSSPPDFYICKPLEWHHLPPNLHELPCPILGVGNADHDVHIQTVYEKLAYFDEFVLMGEDEASDVAALAKRPVSIFTKIYALPDLPPLPPTDRTVDLLFSGTSFHPYHPDKARILKLLLAIPDVDVRCVLGFLPSAAYHELLGRSRICFAFIRHSRGFPTRGLEALAMGNVLIIHKESSLLLYVGENEGIVTYCSELELPTLIRRILGHWPIYEERARRGATLVRSEFEKTQVSSQFLRFMTFVAARPREIRRPIGSVEPSQKRIVLRRGPVFHPAQSKRFRDENLVRWSRQWPVTSHSRPYIDAGRELLLEFTTAVDPDIARDSVYRFGVAPQVDMQSLHVTLHLWQMAIARFPRSLVLRFNLIRGSLYFGGPVEVVAGLELAEETLAQPAEYWIVDPMEDVFPWDFYSQMFNYRRYFEIVMRQMVSGEPITRDLVKLLLASVHYHLSFYRDAARHARRAVELDPEFTFYLLQWARNAITLPSVDRKEVQACLSRLFQESILDREAFELLTVLRGGQTLDPEEYSSMAAQLALVRSRIYTSKFGVENWGYLPLRGLSWPISVDRFRDVITVAKTESTSRVMLDQEPRVSDVQRRPRILLIVLEGFKWREARSISYPSFLGLAEGLEANGFDVVTIPVRRGGASLAEGSWLSHLPSLFKESRFDQIWMELVHISPGENILNWISQAAPIRVGVIMESLDYDFDVCVENPELLCRRKVVEHRLKYMTHAVMADERDVEEFNRNGIIPSAWITASVPQRFILQPGGTGLNHDTRAVFHGTVYGNRRRFLDYPGLADSLAYPNRTPEELSHHAELFEELQLHSVAALLTGSMDPAVLLKKYVACLFEIRRDIFLHWIRSLQRWGSVVNLESLQKGYGGRVFEGIAAGRPVISWRIPDRPATNNMFVEGEEILLFDRNSPEQLATIIRLLRADRNFANRIAENAQKKLRCLYTTEAQIERIMDWIHNCPTTTSGKTASKSSEKAAPRRGL